MRLVRHPFIERDLIGIVDHILDVTGGDAAAAERRLDEIDALIADIAANPTSGMRLDPPLDGWLVRHGGRGQRLTVVFHPDVAQNTLYLALVAFGGRDWMQVSKQRRAAEER